MAGAVNSCSVSMAYGAHRASAYQHLSKRSMSIMHHNIAVTWHLAGAFIMLAAWQQKNHQA